MNGDKVRIISVRTLRSEGVERARCDRCCQLREGQLCYVASPHGMEYVDGVSKVPIFACIDMESAKFVILRWGVVEVSTHFQKRLLKVETAQAIGRYPLQI